MLKPEQNQALMEVGPGTLMGDLLRWYWTPFAAVAEMEQHLERLNRHYLSLAKEQAASA